MDFIISLTIPDNFSRAVRRVVQSQEHEYEASELHDKIRIRINNGKVILIELSSAPREIITFARRGNPVVYDRPYLAWACLDRSLILVPF